MTTILEKISQIKNLYHTRKATFMQIKRAQNELNLIFPEEYVSILNNYGTISFYGTEWTGLNVEEYLNVVSCTKAERNRYNNFPSEMFVLENLGIEGLLIISNQDGDVYSWQNGNKKKIADSIYDYLEICIRRDKK